MASSGRVGTIQLLLLLVPFAICLNTYRIPEVRIQALSPKGFRASVEDAPGISSFGFYGTINHDIGATDVGAISKEVKSSVNGRWVVEIPNLQLKASDVIKYHVFMEVDGIWYLADNLTYVVTDLEDPSSPSPSPSPAPVYVSDVCRPTVTEAIGARACGGQTIFEDNFDSLRQDIWQIEHYYPVSHPEHPFVTYQRVAEHPTVTTNSDGHLVIRPTLQQDLPGFSNESIFTGTLNLFNECTGPGESCAVSASTYNILPPVVSGRITSKAFAFTYGTVHVKAKLPQGDWLYPEILLVPFLQKYGGQDYASGVMKIATARGNKELSTGHTDYSNRILYGGLIMDFDCREFYLKNKVLASGGLWGDDFHEYSLRWAPDRITLSVDGEEWCRIEPAASGLVGKFPRSCRHLPRTLLSHGSKMAPFDQHFQLSFGVAAGSVTEFPQGASTAEGHPKPWVNTSPKAQLKFWEDVNTWTRTWVDPELLIDYVKVVAL